MHARARLPSRLHVSAMLNRILTLSLLAPGVLAAQIPATLQAERADYAEWLPSAPGSPPAAAVSTVRHKQNHSVRWLYVYVRLTGWDL